MYLEVFAGIVALACGVEDAYSISFFLDAE